MYLNQLTIFGFTGQDADFHYTRNGTAVTTFSVATKESWKNDKGEWQSRTDWHRLVTFGKLAEYTRTLPRTHVMCRDPYAPSSTRATVSSAEFLNCAADTAAKLDRAERREEESTVSDI